MLVSEIMNKNVVTVTPDETVAVASRLLSRHNIGSMPVCQKDGVLRGVITDRDIVLRCIANDCDPHETPVRDVMSRSVVTVSPDDSVSVCAGEYSAAILEVSPILPAANDASIPISSRIQSSL